ncbi:hypothetical protein [Methylobacterium tarhaniae]|uniref:hypothetical protein n=1 Tax=Methylobacterium tarhaniae TaxID=1187852 RepID=UPI003CFFF8D4
MGGRRPDRVEVGAGILGFGDRSSPRIHVPDVVRNARGPSDLAPLALEGVAGVGPTLLFINDQRADAPLRQNVSGDLLDVGQSEKSCAIIAPAFVVALRVTPSSTAPAQVRPFTSAGR